MNVSAVMWSPLVSIAVWVTLLPLLAFHFVLSKRINSFAGPYIAFAHSWESCPSDKTLELLFRPSHFSRSRPYDLQTISGNISFKGEITDNILTDADLAIWSNNQWKENAFIFRIPRSGCSVVRDDIPDFFRILTKYNGARRDPCVVPAAHSVLKNEPVNWTFPHFPIMPYGRYRFQFRARKTREGPAILCVSVDCEVIPKP
ncbi:uncharacterized protein LOC117640074 isoform X1 [Thrips palmi]|uniref:Uncharacterized protein LOC117640074 isoform X1 n=1 Tax=Thrips palmi TaxID=161013 RepID=A0A6P8Y7Y3_THRPL|nr:uncharacterized protein LOC117640074 isoform X1 [Thrips palmi]